MRKFLFAILLIGCIPTFSQSISESKGKLITFKDFGISETNVEALKKQFRAKESLTEETVKLLYGNFYLSNMERWYGTFELDNVQLIPLKIKQEKDMHFFHYALSDVDVEDFYGKIEVVRVLIDREWVGEVFYFSGSDTSNQPGKVSVSFTIVNGMIQAKRTKKVQSPGVLYYAYEPIEVGLDAKIEYYNIDEYLVYDNQLKLRKASKSDTVYLTANDRLREYINANNSVEGLIDRVLDADIGLEKQFNIIYALVQEQVENFPAADQPSQIAYVQGNQIWVRSKPGDGDVVLKLDEGTVCLLTGKGPYEEIRDMTGHWYQIHTRFGGGWIYGSQLMLPSTATIEKPMPTSKEPLRQEGIPRDVGISDLEKVFLYVVISFIGAFVLGLMILWFRTVYLWMKGLHRKQIDVSEYNPGPINEDKNRIQQEIGRLSEKIEFERQKTYRKSKKAFWGTVRNIFAFFLLGELLIIYKMVSEAGGSLAVLSIPGIVVPMFACILVSFFVGGVYWMLRGARIHMDYAEEFKMLLVYPVLQLIDASLHFQNKGMGLAEFSKSDIFRVTGRYGNSAFGKNQQCRLRSYDTIQKIEDEEQILRISEVDYSNEIFMNREHPNYYVSRSGTGSKERNRIFTSVIKGFVGVLPIPMAGVSGIIKVLPAAEAEYHHKDNLNAELDKVLQKKKDHLFTQNDYRAVTGRLKLKEIDPEERRDSGEYMDGKFHVYSSDAAEAAIVFSPNFRKLLKYLIRKFGEEKVYISIRNNVLYLALNLDKDLFEPETLLKKPLSETNIVKRIYEDVIFISQLSKEVGSFKLILGKNQPADINN